MPKMGAKRSGFWQRLSSANRLYGIVSIAAIVLIIAAAVVLLTKDETTNKTVGAPADTCSQKNDISFGCYKEELEQIISDQGPEYAFALLKDQYEKVPYIKSQCHQLTHVVGRASYYKYGNLSDTFAHGAQFCWS